MVCSPGRPAATRLGNAITLPSQEVDREGLVVVPYAGRVRAAGSTPAELAARNHVQVEGAGTRSRRSLLGFALLDTRAASASWVTSTPPLISASMLVVNVCSVHSPVPVVRAHPDYETRISLERGGVVAQVKLSDITTDPVGQHRDRTRRHRVCIASAGLLHRAWRDGSERQPQSWWIGRISFGSAHLTLADALARAGGLEDDRANAKEVFVFRYESPATSPGDEGACQLGDNLHLPRSSTHSIFAIRLGCSTPAVSKIRPEDIIYASNASSTDLMKIETLLMPLVDAGVTAAVVR